MNWLKVYPKHEELWSEIAAIPGKFKKTTRGENTPEEVNRCFII
jgi:hypothetical protein